ncbi:MAG: 1-(5-phosphoribosyl)-5-[(5-phosphoribosylamino)methylideneamino]imidazole-4-carboxamide isomerase [Bacteroidota bacterium]
MIRIPAIDLINGRCVRLTKGEFDKKKIYDLDPLETAKKYEAYGAKRIHIVDLDAARNVGTNRDVIFSIRKETNLEVQTGGGILTVDQIKLFLDEGVSSLILGSIAQKEREKVRKWISDFGSEQLIIGADVRNDRIAVDGWLNTSEENITDFVNYYLSAGATTFLCTDIQKDGMLQGTSNTLYKNLISKFPKAQLIASGGVSSIEDLELLEDMQMYACVIGKALFEYRISLDQLFNYKEKK